MLIEIPEPSLREQAEIFTIERCWTNALRNTFNQPSHRSLFTSLEPWKCDDPKQRTRWRSFSNIALMLQKHNISPEQFCTAVMQYHFQRNRIPAVKVVSKDFGLRIWQEWKQTCLAEGAGDTIRLSGAVRTAMASSQSDRLVRAMRRAYQEMLEYGPTDIDIEWGPQVLYAIWYKVPVARDSIKIELRKLATRNPEMSKKWGEAFKRIKKNPHEQSFVLRLWNQATITKSGTTNS